MKVFKCPNHGFCTIKKCQVSDSIPANTVSTENVHEIISSILSLPADQYQASFDGSNINRSSEETSHAGAMSYEFPGMSTVYNSNNFGPTSYTSAIGMTTKKLSNFSAPVAGEFAVKKSSNSRINSNHRFPDNYFVTGM